MFIIHKLENDTSKVLVEVSTPMLLSIIIGYGITCPNDREEELFGHDFTREHTNMISIEDSSFDYRKHSMDAMALYRLYADSLTSQGNNTPDNILCEGSTINDNFSRNISGSVTASESNIGTINPNVTGSESVTPPTSHRIAITYEPHEVITNTITSDGNIYTLLETRTEGDGTIVATYYRVVNSNPGRSTSGSLGNDYMTYGPNGFDVTSDTDVHLSSHTDNNGVMTYGLRNMWTPSMTTPYERFLGDRRRDNTEVIGYVRNNEGIEVEVSVGSMLHIIGNVEETERGLYMRDMRDYPNGSLVAFNGIEYIKLSDVLWVILYRESNRSNSFQGTISGESASNASIERELPYPRTTTVVNGVRLNISEEVDATISRTIDAIHGYQERERTLSRDLGLAGSSRLIVPVEYEEDGHYVNRNATPDINYTISTPHGIYGTVMARYPGDRTNRPYSSIAYPVEGVTTGTIRYSIPGMSSLTAGTRIKIREVDYIKVGGLFNPVDVTSYVPTTTANLERSITHSSTNEEVQHLVDSLNSDYLNGRVHVSSDDDEEISEAEEHDGYQGLFATEEDKLKEFDAVSCGLINHMADLLKNKSFCCSQEMTAEFAHNLDEICAMPVEQLYATVSLAKLHDMLESINAQVSVPFEPSYGELLSVHREDPDYFEAFEPAEEISVQAIEGGGYHITGIPECSIGHIVEVEGRSYIRGPIAFTMLNEEIPLIDREWVSDTFINGHTIPGHYSIYPACTGAVLDSVRRGSLLLPELNSKPLGTIVVVGESEYIKVSSVRWSPYDSQLRLPRAINPQRPLRGFATISDPMVIDTLTSVPDNFSRFIDNDERTIDTISGYGTLPIRSWSREQHIIPSTNSLTFNNEYVRTSAPAILPQDSISDEGYASTSIPVVSSDSDFIPLTANERRIEASGIGTIVRRPLENITNADLDGLMSSEFGVLLDSEEARNFSLIGMDTATGPDIISQGIRLGGGLGSRNLLNTLITNNSYGTDRVDLLPSNNGAELVLRALEEIDAMTDEQVVDLVERSNTPEDPGVMIFNGRVIRELPATTMNVDSNGDPVDYGDREYNESVEGSEENTLEYSQMGTGNENLMRCLIDVHGLPTYKTKNGFSLPTTDKHIPGTEISVDGLNYTREGDGWTWLN